MIEKIVEKFQNQLIRFAFYRIGSLEVAQDIVQDVFIRFFEKKQDFKTMENPKSFLYKSIGNQCIDYHRKNKIEFISIDSISESHFINNSNHYELKAEYEQITHLLNCLPEEQSEILKLRIIDELEFKEIAEITGIPVATAKSRFRYGIDKLKNKIQTKNVVNNEL